MPTVTSNIFNQMPENLAKGVHNFSSDAACTVTMALCAAANAPVATNSVLADLTQISYTNLSSRVVTGIAAEQTSGSLNLVGNNLTLTASGGAVATFRYVVFYDDDPTSPADPLICWVDLGSDQTLADGDTRVFTLTGGICQIAKL